MQQETHLTAAVRRHLPRMLAEHVRVAQATPPRLVVAVPTGAVATAVRQRSRDVLAGLHREGLHFTQIDLRVQVGGNARSGEKPVPNQRTSPNSAPLRELVRQLPAGPLRDAVARLARRGK
ncbi:MAG: DUF721 domain-containing protein [Burkholderiales bacterium]|nr:DUF721 domain-containing protein [Burkholderiales bacterium]